MSYPKPVKNRIPMDDITISNEVHYNYTCTCTFMCIMFSVFHNFYILNFSTIKWNLMVYLDK